MAGTTTNYGWTYPTSTDLVKDGATAIQTAIQGADTSLFNITTGKNVGLVPLNTTTFTAQSSVSINSVFSSTYDNYLVVYNITASSATVIRQRLRVAGADNTGSNYLRGGMYVGVFANSVFSSTNNVTEAYFTLGSTSATVGYGGVLNFIAPFQTQYTKITSHSGGADMGIGTCVFNGTTSFDGFTLLPDTGTITGTIRVYGYRNS